MARMVRRVLVDVVTVDRIDRDATRTVIGPNTRKLSTQVLDERAVVADEYDERRRGVVAKRMQSAIRVRQRERRRTRAKRKHLRFDGSHFPSPGSRSDAKNIRRGQ